MTKRNTRRALLMSALSLVLCMSMLIGSTFAWFTDSVTSAGNKIQSGTLKLDLELLDKESGKWNSIKEEPNALFDYDKWEPGYTEAKVLKVENEGSLALKWYAKFVAEDGKEVSELADAIDVYVLAYGVLDDASSVAYPGRDLAGYTKVGTLAEFINTIETTTYGSLQANESAYLGLALKMQEEAGNEYQGLDLAGAFDIQILAAQLNSESDSFGTSYDMYAEYDNGEQDDNINVGTASDLLTALTNLSAGQSVTLTQDIDLTGANWDTTAPWQGSGTDVVFDGAGHKITGLTTDGIRGGLFGRYATNGNVTIKNLILEDVKLTGTDEDGESAGGALIGWYESHGGTLTIENVKVNSVDITGFKYIGGLIGYVNPDYDVNIIDCSVNGTAVTSTYNESGNYKGHIGGLIGYYGKGTVTNCTVSDLAVKRAGTAEQLSSSSNRTGALFGTVTANCVVESATVENVTVDGVAASTDNVFGPAYSATSVSKANIVIK